MPVSQQVSAVLWGLGVGAALVIVIYLTIRGAWFRMPLIGGRHEDGSLPEPAQPIHEYADGLAEAHGPVPTIVKLVIISFVAWAVGYVVLFVQRGYTFL